ncbi:MAG: ribC, partial [Rhodospirillaceae bacterium]
GTVRRVARTRGDAQFEFNTHYDAATIETGASIACSGCCLTVINRGPGWFAVQVSSETLTRTTLGHWHPGTPVNFERALRVGDELGGHMVFGHADGVATVAAIRLEGDSRRFTIVPPLELMRHLASKGSVAVDGVSLTINDVGPDDFGVNIIPHTQAVTTLGQVQAGDRVNMEIDMLARYVARLLGKD